MDNRHDYVRMLWAGSVEFAECIYLFGLSVLKEHLQVAAHILIQGTPKLLRSRTRGFLGSQDEIKESFAFINGTGLDLVIQNYGINVDPDRFREIFYEWIEYQKRLRLSRCASATTPAISSNGV